MASPQLSFNSNLPSSDWAERIYRNDGNEPLLGLLGNHELEILDVGCGAGDNARLSRRLGWNRKFYGITRSQSELLSASKVMEECWLQDIESSSLEFLENRRFDAIIFSHVLEHLIEPWSVLAAFLRFLKPGGVVLIAVPNVLSWRQRLQFVRGRFEYQDDGVMDITHLRFFTFDSADAFLLKLTPSLKVERKVADGSVPLWFLRHYLLGERVRKMIDELGCSRFPNLFAGQVLIKARMAAEAESE